MESDSWSRFFAAAASKRHQPAAAQQSRYDLYLGFDEVDAGDDDARTEFQCPFCAEDFDIIGLCHHIEDEHPVEAMNGDLDSLIGTYTHRRRKFRKGSSHSPLSLLKKELRDGNLQALLGGSSYMAAPSAAAPDPVLSALIYTLPVADSSKDVQSESFDEGSLVNISSDEKVKERSSSSESSLSDKDQVERARRSEFVQGLLLSTIFEDAL